MMYRSYKNSFMATHLPHVVLALLVLTQQTWCIPPTSSEETYRGLLTTWHRK